MNDFLIAVSVKKGVSLMQAKTDLEIAQMSAFLQLLNMMTTSGNPVWAKWAEQAQNHLVDHLSNVAESLKNE
jgi:iron only hydrogenase large subunit-like protein